jgi:ribosomal protein L7Ae-like RNA K-turn-binding protein
MKDLTRIAGLLGLAQKAGKLALGSDAVEKALRQRKIYVLVFAEDASQATTGQLETLAMKNDVPVFYLSSRDELGKLVGREALAVLGIIDSSFANGITRLIEESEHSSQ